MTTEHDWKAVPYDESYAMGQHRQAAPYLWRCHDCHGTCRTTSEAYPSHTNVGLYPYEASPLDHECPGA